jgi:hypothetical protein
MSSSEVYEMIKISPAKNSLAIDHRAPQTDCNVSHKANLKQESAPPTTTSLTANSKARVGSCSAQGHRGQNLSSSMSGTMAHFCFYGPFASPFFFFSFLLLINNFLEEL